MQPERGINPLSDNFNHPCMHLFVRSLPPLSLSLSERERRLLSLSLLSLSPSLSRARGEEKVLILNEK